MSDFNPRSFNAKSIYTNLISGVDVTSYHEVDQLRAITVDDEELSYSDYVELCDLLRQRSVCVSTCRTYRVR